jgi:hypothetical protein
LRRNVLGQRIVHGDMHVGHVYAKVARAILVERDVSARCAHTQRGFVTVRDNGYDALATFVQIAVSFSLVSIEQRDAEPTAGTLYGQRRQMVVGCGEIAHAFNLFGR